MLQLRELQAGFASDLQMDHLQTLAGAIENGKFPADKVFQVYRNNYFLSLTEALKSVYVSVEKLVGEGFFAFAADGYIRRFPSRSGNLHDFGLRFNDYLSELEEATDLPYLPDVAQIDWAWHKAYHAGDAESIQVNRLAEIDPVDYGRLEFEFHPSLTCLCSNYSIHEVWHFCRQDSGTDNNTHLEIGEANEFVAVFRNALDIHVELISKSAFEFLQELLIGNSLETTAANVIEKNDSFDLLQTLQQFFAFHLITDVRLQP